MSTEEIQIVIVDDEPYLAELLGQMLSHFGYRVKTFSTAEAALEFLAQSPAELVITDHFLHDGELSGLDLVRHAWSAWSLPAIVCTACIDEPILTALRAEPNVRELVRKPFDILQLKDRVGEIIGPPREGGASAAESSSSP